MPACDCVYIAITQDYTEEFRDIAKGSKSKEALPAGSITLINQRPVGEDLHVKISSPYFLSRSFFNHGSKTTSQNSSLTKQQTIQCGFILLLLFHFIIIFVFAFWAPKFMFKFNFSKKTCIENFLFQ